jgi:hypothetical protein
LASRIFFCNFILRVKRYREREDRGIGKRRMRKGEEEGMELGG